MGSVQAAATELSRERPAASRGAAPRTPSRDARRPSSAPNTRAVGMRTPGAPGAEPTVPNLPSVRSSHAHTYSSSAARVGSIGRARTSPSPCTPQAHVAVAREVHQKAWQTSPVSMQSHTTRTPATPLVDLGLSGSSARGSSRRASADGGRSSSPVQNLSRRFEEMAASDAQTTQKFLPRVKLHEESSIRRSPPVGGALRLAAPWWAAGGSPGDAAQLGSGESEEGLDGKWDQRLEGDALRAALADAATRAAASVADSPGASRASSPAGRDTEGVWHGGLSAADAPLAHRLSPAPPCHTVPADLHHGSATGMSPACGVSAVDVVADALAAAVYGCTRASRPYDAARYADAEPRSRSPATELLPGSASLTLSGDAPAPKAQAEGDLSVMLDSLEMQSALFQDHLRECARLIFERRTRAGETSASRPAT